MFRSGRRGERHPRALERALARVATRMIRRTRTPEKGAAAVEFALILPLLVLMLFGTIDVAFLLNDTTKLRSSVRETARRAVVGEYGNQICPLSGATTVNSARQTESEKLLCLSKYYAIDSAKMDVRTAVRIVRFNTDGTVQAGTDRDFEIGNAVVVCGQVKGKSRTGLLASTFGERTIKSVVVMRISQNVNNGPGQAEELSHDGANWDFCHA